jgi:hypothetical protein
MEETRRHAVAKGYVETLFGRRRLFDFQARELQALRGRSLQEVRGGCMGAAWGAWGRVRWDTGDRWVAEQRS